MATTPNSIVTPQGPKSAFAEVTTASTDFDTAPTTVVLLLTAGANGARLTRLIAYPCENVTAGFLQVYRSIDAGTTKYLGAAAACGTDTVSATDAPTVIDFGYSDSNPMILQASEKIYVATGISKKFHFTAEYADY